MANQKGTDNLEDLGVGEKRILKCVIYYNIKRLHTMPERLFENNCSLQELNLVSATL